jgi:hypothetical protein
MVKISSGKPNIAAQLLTLFGRQPAAAGELVATEFSGRQRRIRRHLTLGKPMLTFGTPTRLRQNRAGQQHSDHASEPEPYIRLHGLSSIRARILSRCVDHCSDKHPAITSRTIAKPALRATVPS